MADDTLHHPPARPAGVFPGLAAFGRHGRATGPAGVVVQERVGPRLAHVASRRGREASLGEAVRATFGIDPPKVGRRHAGAQLVLTGIGSGQWLAEVAPREPAPGAPAIETVLRPALGASAAIVDQSHARIILRLTGPRVRDLLATGLPIDLHPRAFGPGDAAQSIIAHIGVVIWQLDDEPTYELAVPRSLIGSLWNWLAAGAARHGLEVGVPIPPIGAVEKAETPQ